MRKDNPACYECPRGKNALHVWHRSKGSKIAICVMCGLELNEADTKDCFND